MKSKYVTYLIFYGFIVLILGVVLWHTGKMMVVKEQMEQYLKEKYGKEFVVQELGYYYPFFGGNLYYKGICYPKEDKKMKFELKRVVNKEKFYKYPPGYSESYIYDLWNKETTEKLKKQLHHNLIYTSGAAYIDENKFFGKTVSIDQALDMFERKISLYVDYGVLIDFNEYSKKYNEFKNLKTGNLTKEQINTLFAIIQKIKDRRYREIRLNLIYLDKSKSDEIVKDMRKYLHETVDYSESIILCEIQIDNINLINKPEDIKNMINLSAGYLYEVF